MRWFDGRTTRLDAWVPGVVSGGSVPECLKAVKMVVILVKYRV